MKAKVHQEFEYTAEGYRNARRWAKEIGRLDELDSRGNGFSTDGYSQVQQCNMWYNELNNNSNTE